MSGCGCGNISLPSGANGLNGFNAFTVTTTGFTMPNIGGTVTLNVSNTGQFTGAWAAPTQILYVDGVGHFEVITSTPTTILVQNTGYTGNAAPATVFTAINLAVSPAGLQGTTGSNGTNGAALIDFDVIIGETTNVAPTYAKDGQIPANYFATNGDAVEVRFQVLTDAAVQMAEYRLFLDDYINPQITADMDSFILPQAGRVVTFTLIRTAANTLSFFKESIAGGVDYANNKVTLNSTAFSDEAGFHLVSAGNTLDFTQAIDINLYVNVLAGAPDRVKNVYWKITKLVMP